MQPLLFALLLAALLLAAPVLSTAPLRDEGPGQRRRSSRGEARLACLFRDTWSQHDGQSWKPLPEDTAGLKTNRGSHKLSSGRRRRLLLRPLVSRQRRGDPVNPSDPLQSESHPSNPGTERQEPGPEVSEQDQARAVSKETIASYDDPLEVLHSIRPVSPIKTNIAERAEQD
ncbi:unnamed protein product [Merluccius merluccius]